MKHRLPDRFVKLSGALLILTTLLSPQTEQIRKDVKGKGLIFDPSETQRLEPTGPVQSQLDLPLATDLSYNMPPAGHQGGQNSCVGWAVAYAVKSYQEKIEENRSYFAAGGLDLSRIFSPAFIYNQINNGQNNGASFKKALDLVVKQGVASWSDMPYNVTDFLSQPSPAARRNASRYRITGYTRINIGNKNAIKYHLNQGNPIIFGAMVDEAFESLGPGVIWDSIGEPTGGHAMVLVGYDDNRSAFKILNSWGQYWADNGYCWVDYDHFQSVAKVGYVLKDAHNRPPPPSKGRLSVTNLHHNRTNPVRPHLGVSMNFIGTLSVAAGQGRTCQVVIYFYYDLGDGKRGGPVRSLNDSFKDTNGNTACGSLPQNVSSEGLFKQWEAWIPYSVFDVPRGRRVSTPEGQVYQKVTTNLVAVPILFIDNLRVIEARPILFNVTF